MIAYRLRVALLSVAAALATTDARAADRVWEVATLEWPPFASPSVMGGGLTTEIVRRAGAAISVAIMVHYLPWKRAIDRAGSPASPIAAYYPGYHCRHRPGFVASKPIGRTPLGLAERVDRPINWRSLSDLARLRIGVVLGYANTAEFDQAVAAGALRVINSLNDASNLKKLVNFEIDAAVVDSNVFRYLMRIRPELSKHLGALRLNEQWLKNQSLHVCFTDTPVGRAMRDRFDSGLANLDIDRIADRFFDDLVRAP